MTISALAGKPAPKAMLVDLIRLEREYYARKPDTGDANQLVAFGTSGHRGPRRRDHSGHLRLPAWPWDRRPSLHGQGHPRTLGPGAAHGARGARRQRGGNDHP